MKIGGLKFVIGTTRIPDVPATFHVREIFPGEAGLLGNATLSRFQITIDAVHNRLLLDPPAE